LWQARPGQLEVADLRFVENHADDGDDHWRAEANANADGRLSYPAIITYQLLFLVVARIRLFFQKVLMDAITLKRVLVLRIFL